MSVVQTRQPRRSEKSKTSIVAATLALILEVGYEGLTVEGIAARAQVGKQTLYRWWGSKAGVVVDVLVSGENVFVWPTRDRERPAEADLRRWTSEMVLAFSTEPRRSMMKALETAIAEDSTAALQWSELVGGPARQQLVGILGEVVPDAAPSDLQLAAAMYEGIFASRIHRPGSPVTDEFAQSMLDLLLRGLRAPAR